MIGCNGSTLGTMAGSSVDVCENSVCFLCDFSGEYIAMFGEYSLIEYSVVGTSLVTRVVGVVFAVVGLGIGIVSVGRYWLGY